MLILKALQLLQPKPNPVYICRDKSLIWSWCKTIIQKAETLNQIDQIFYSHDPKPLVSLDVSSPVLLVSPEDPPRSPRGCSGSLAWWCIWNKCSARQTRGYPVPILKSLAVSKVFHFLGVSRASSKESRGKFYLHEYEWSQWWF